MTDQRFNWEDGFELLRNANQYLRFCVGVNTPREEAQARFDARAIIIRLEHEVLDEAESRSPITEQHIGDIAEKH